MHLHSTVKISCVAVAVAACKAAFVELLLLPMLQPRVQQFLAACILHA